jgi:putative SOS response-associated peptidase YedK
MHLRFVLVSDLLTIEKRFHTIAHPDISAIPKSYSVACGDNSYVITEPNTIQVFRYGMTPNYASEQLNITTARTEGKKNKKDDPSYAGSKAIFLQPEFKKLIFTNRCIIVADAFYVLNEKNQPYLGYLQGKSRPIGFAGIYDSWRNPETKETENGFCIITTTANQMLQSIGVKRMPVILPFQYETNWLKPLLHLSEVLRYLGPYPSDKMNAYPVADLVNGDNVNEAKMIEPIGEKLQDETVPVTKIRSYYPHKSKPSSGQPWFKVNSKG